MDPLATPSVDISDPIVVGATWFLTWAAGRWLSSTQRQELRAYLPVLAIAVAVGIRGLISYSEGTPYTVDAMFRAFAAGATAVWSQAASGPARRAASAPTPTQPAPPVDEAGP